MPTLVLILALFGLAAAQEPITAKNSSQALRQAELLDRQGDWSAAALVLNQMLEAKAPLTTANDKHLRGAALLSAAKVARKLGNHDEALRHQLAYRRLLSDIPNADLLIEQRCENTLAIAESQLLQGQFREAQATIEELLQGESGPVPTLPRIEANLLAGAAHHLQGRADSAKRHWQAAADATTGVLRDSRSLSNTARLRFAALSLTAHEALDDSQNAEQEFEQALRRLDSSDKSSVDRFEARYAVFARARLRRDLVRTERHLRDLTREPLVASRSLLAADLFWTLASLQRDLDRTDDARTTSRQALTMYSAAAAKIEASLSAAPDTANAAVPASKRALLSCLRRLCALQQELGELTAALRSAAQVRQLTVDLFSENPTAIIEARTTEAILLAASGNYEAARPALFESVTFWRQQADTEPLKLARALNDLAAVERGIGNLSAAVAGFREALQLRKQHLAADDPELATSFRNLAGAYAALGQFVSAIELHQQVLESCARRGSRADGLQSTTLLEMAIAYKSQGLYPRATELCRQSLSLQEAMFGPEHFGAVAHHDALAALARLERRDTDAEQHAQTMLRLCELHHREQNELAAAAWYHLGIVAASQGRLDAADAYWRKTLSIQQANGQQTLAARTWNRLGLLAYRKQELTEAERCFESALQLQDATSPRIQDRYSSLCNLAVIRQEQKELPAALELLREAIELTEAPRAATIGAEQERAEYLAQFATAFDLLFDWSLRSGQIDEAFAVAERSRSRTFLDQLRLAGIDLRRSLTGESRQSLLAHEAEARAAVQRLQTELQSRLANRSSEREVTNARQRLLAAQREFTKAWISIRNANPIYRELLTSRDRLLSLPEIQLKCLTDGEFMLYYHLGSRRSDVLLIGGGKHVPQRFELQLPIASIDLLKSSATRSATKPGEPDPTRGASGLVISDKGADLSDGDDSPALRAGTLTRRQAASLVTWYLSQIRQRQLPEDRVRGQAGTVQSSKADDQKGVHTLLADVLLPKALREELQRLQPRHVIVVPDGALHQLPLEALLLDETPRPQYVLDEFPPLSYVPSANVLANLIDRRNSAARNSETLLTVGDPAYSSDQTEGALSRDMSVTYRGHGGQLERLPATRQECERVAQAFSTSKVVMLLGEQATKRRVIEELPQANWVHLAAHGLVDERFSNLFGAIALTPATRNSSSPGDDGLLTYEEILNIPLKCELAILSACETTVGPERPLEMGTSLAQAFLAAGAKRVVASHWTVADESTAELMAVFASEFQRTLHSEREPQQGLDHIFATSLKRARIKLRNSDRWPSPYFWAPFVLIGPGR